MVGLLYYNPLTHALIAYPGELFGRDGALDKIATDWVRRFNSHQSSGLTEIVNLALRASGCDIEVNFYDIEDPDSATMRLTEIQEDFQKVWEVLFTLVLNSNAD